MLFWRQSKSNKNFLNGYLPRLFNLLFSAPRKTMFAKILLVKKWMVLEIVDKNVFK